MTDGARRTVRVRSRWRRHRARRELQRTVEQLAERADRAATTWRVQPIIEICTAEHYAAWRKAREKTWRRERSDFHTRSWPGRLLPGEIAGVLLPQSYGGHYRGRPAEIAMPVFIHSQPPRSAGDFDDPSEPIALRLAAGWVRMAQEDLSDDQALLLAPPLVDFISSRPGPRIPEELGITWPLAPSEPHIHPARGTG